MNVELSAIEIVGVIKWYFAKWESENKIAIGNSLKQQILEEEPWQKGAIRFLKLYDAFENQTSILLRGKETSEK